MGLLPADADPALNSRLASSDGFGQARGIILGSTWRVAAAAVVAEIFPFAELLSLPKKF